MLLKVVIVIQYIVSFCLVSILSVDYGYAIHEFGPYGKYSDLSFLHGSHFVNSVRTSKLRSKYFPVWTSKLVNKSILPLSFPLTLLPQVC